MNIFRVLALQELSEPVFQMPANGHWKELRVNFTNPEDRERFRLELQYRVDCQWVKREGSFCWGTTAPRYSDAPFSLFREDFIGPNCDVYCNRLDEHFECSQRDGVRRCQVGWSGTACNIRGNFPLIGFLNRFFPLFSCSTWPFVGGYKRIQSYRNTFVLKRVSSI